MVKIGMIGMNQGNAHPISWSSIVNGKFDGEQIAQLGFPGVTDYLNANQDTLGIAGAQVTHLWTQDRNLSEAIATGCGIAHPCDNLEDMIGAVDAVIIARDDAEHHRAMAEQFVEADIPVFIDKPLAINRTDLEWFKAMHDAGKFIMSCSSTRYSVECRSLKAELPTFGKLAFAICIGRNDWEKYGIHRLESIFALLGDPIAASIQALGEVGNELMCIKLKDGMHLTIHLSTEVTATAQLSVYGQHKSRTIEIANAYAMFRQNIVEFIRSVNEDKPRLEFSKTYRLMELMIAGIKSRESGGKVVKL